MNKAATTRALSIIMLGSILSVALAQGPSLADAPSMCYVSSGGGASIIVGDGFDSSTRIIEWNTRAGRDDMLSYATGSKGEIAVPSTPPEGARVLNPINVASNQVLNVDLSSDPEVLWVRTSAGTSPPMLVNMPEVWLTTDDDPIAGEHIRLFGRNFDPNGTQTKDQKVFFRSLSTGKTYDATLAMLSEQSLVHVDDHMMGLVVPDRLPAGSYDILVHTSGNSAFAWSAPYRVSVLPHHTLAQTLSRPWAASPGLKVDVIPVPGLTAGGFADNTSAIQTALDHAAGVGGGVVLLPPGQYAISTTLRIPPGVFLKGSGEEETAIVVSPSNPLHGGLPNVTMAPSLSWQRGYAGDWAPWWKTMTPMIWIRTEAGVSDISLVGGPGARCSIFVATKDWRQISNDVSIVRTDFSTPESIFLTEPMESNVFGMAVGSTTRHFTLYGCHFRCSNATYMLPPRPENYGTTMSNNVFDVYPRHLTGAGGGSSLTHAVIENNVFNGVNRALGFSRGFNDSWVYNNEIVDDGQGVNGDEMYMCEYGTSLWAGSCESATANTIQAQGASWSDGQYVQCSDPIFVFIKLGKGFGQFRRVIGNTSHTLTIDRPWDVLPDSTSRFAIIGAAYHILYINDEALDCNGRCEFAFGSLVDCVIQGMNTRDCEGISTTACDSGVVAFNRYYQNRLIGLSGIHLSAPNQYDTDIISLPGIDTGPNRVGNVFCNTIEQNEVISFKQYALNQYWNTWDTPGYVPAPADDPAISISDGSYNMISDNYVTNGPIGILIEGGVGNTVTKNRMDDVARGVLDQAKDTHVDGNKTLSATPSQ